MHPYTSASVSASLTNQTWSSDIVSNIIPKRHMDTLNAEIFIDAADPYSMEVLLGPVQRLIAEDIGPVRWRVLPHSNIGQARGKRVNCRAGVPHARALSCGANSIMACAADVFGSQVIADVDDDGITSPDNQVEMTFVKCFSTNLLGKAVQVEHIRLTLG